MGTPRRHPIFQSHQKGAGGKGTSTSKKLSGGTYVLARADFREAL